jgi:hypothetical protein
MGLFELIIFLALIGLVTWAVVTYIPMSAGIKQIIQIAAIVVAVWIVLNAFGLVPRDVPVPKF